MPKSDQPGLFGPGAQADAAKAPGIRGLAVREAPCKSLLNSSGRGSYSFNCYTGCQHACVYCYARFMQRFHPHDEPWGRFVDVKANAVEVLTRQLRRLPAGAVFTCSACDGWQPLERHYELTRRCCRLLLEAGFHLDILTKSELVLRDLDILAGRDVRLGVTITTADESVARIWEPRASPVAARLRVLREAKAAGLKTAVMFGPLLPGIGDTQEAIEALFRLAADAGVDRIWTDALNPRPRVWPSVRQLLARRYPRLLEFYRRMLYDPAGRAAYLDQLHSRIRQIAAAAGLSDRID